MNPDAASATALGTSMMRALHARADPEPILHDSLGDRLVPTQARVVIYQRVRSHRPELPEHPDPGTLQAVVEGALRTSVAYANVIVRSRYTEDALHAAVARGVRNYVLIGAGFDSYAWRRPPASAALNVVEIDHPATQAMKRACVDRAGLGNPGPIHFLPADLAREDLAAVLHDAPMPRDEPVFVSWLGVTMYLDRAANLATLRALARTAASGSELVFSYFDQAVFDLPDDAVPAPFALLRNRLAALGEPLVSGFDPATLDDTLLSLGLCLIDDVGDADLLRRYDPRGRNALNGSDRSRIARARVL